MSPRPQLKNDYQEKNQMQGRSRICEPCQFQPNKTASRFLLTNPTANLHSAYFLVAHWIACILNCIFCSIHAIWRSTSCSRGGYTLFRGRKDLQKSLLKRHTLICRDGQSTSADFFPLPYLQSRTRAHLPTSLLRAPESACRTLRAKSAQHVCTASKASAGLQVGRTSKIFIRSTQQSIHVGKLRRFNRHFSC